MLTTRAKLENDPASYVDHPLWSRFLRWYTLHPKTYDTDLDQLVLAPHDESSRLESLPDYKHTPSDDPKTDARVVELLPGKFDDDVVIRIHHVTLKPPPPSGEWRATMEQVRDELPPGWEVFQTVSHTTNWVLGCSSGSQTNVNSQIADRKYFFRDMKTGSVQWQHPKANFHPRRTSKYEVPPKDGSFPHYETLSYVWGPDKKTGIVKVDGTGHEGPARLAVTETLLTALRYLRQSDRKRNLWIDALCLNQADKYELSQLVPRMGEIYRLSYNGTAWLGVQGRGSELALAALQHLGEQVVAEGEAGLLFRSTDAEEHTKDWFDPGFELPYDTKTWDAITALLRRPWFTRLWVVQEIHPGAVLQCGQDTIPISAFAEAQYCLYC